jgi:hypothetical protein
LFLQQFVFQIEHCSGRENVITDAISRNSYDLDPNSESWSSDIIVAALNWKNFEKELLKKLKNINYEQKTQAELSLIIKICQENNTQSYQKNNASYQIINNTFCSLHSWRVVVPKSLSNSIVEHFHYNQVHFGIYKTYKQIIATFYWKGTITQVKKFV